MSDKLKNTRLLKVKVKSNKKRTESSRRWLERQLNDPFVHLAKEKGYYSRAAFKLIEINDKYKILKPGTKVIDLGAAPGGWTQVIVEKLKSEQNPKSKVIGVDLNPISSIPQATLIVSDFTLESTQQQLLEMLDGKADVIVSDMAAPACGMVDVDHMRIMSLVEEAYLFAQEVLKPGGHFVAKVLRGGTEANLLKQLKLSFEKVSHFKPQSSRQDSAEMYVVCLKFRQR
ncbi:RlmE family RNA methyltransferase [Candidatus Paracaedibacter symbiosus]|uniref:RlmE family RNA methyltransferase n=1 Tax=Candidatus Paracaedibacter symbiosus TaxID=244582 RepID=UPI000509D021|nr:RlmE family RNA methyltransferase [Candidatus Paracaedibacter symbiosus]